MTSVVLDVQCFKIGNNTFYPKELASYNGDSVSHYVFRPPFPFKHLPNDLRKQAKWLMHNHHCIDWDEGFTPGFLFPKIIQRIVRDADTIFAKGKEKVAFLQKYTNKKIVELNEQPALRATTPSCIHHTDLQCMCALSNVYYLYQDLVMIE